MISKVKVAVADSPPLVIKKGGGYSGFEVELWEAIAKEAKIDFEYTSYNFQEIIPLLERKKADVGLAALTITEKREKLIDYSHPTLDSGLSILVSRDKNGMNLVRSIKSFLHEGYKIIIPPLLLVLAFVLVFANILWFAELGKDTFSHSYFPGIFESIWLVICSMSTDSFGDYVPHTWAGRIVITLIIFGGVAIFGVLIAQITTFMAVKKIRGWINNYHDLTEKNVATVADSTSVDFLEKVGAKVITVTDINQAYEKLRAGEVDAVVFDAPILAHFVKNDNQAREFELLDELFAKQKYGIALQSGSSLREKINQGLLKLHESGFYDSLYRKWFGEDLAMES